jgi:hypothetical protein
MRETTKIGDLLVLRVIRVADILAKEEVVGEDSALPLVGVETPDEYIDTPSVSL